MGVRGAWLRLLVVALLCVTGLARTSTRQSGTLAELRASEPMQLSAAAREAEPTIRKRNIEGPDVDRLAIVDEGREVPGLDPRLADLRAPRHADPTIALLERSRARGPPLA